MAIVYKYRIGGVHEKNVMLGVQGCLLPALQGLPLDKTPAACLAF